MNSTKTDSRTAVFAGSFNPFTIGHASIVERGLSLFDNIVIAVGVNIAKPGAAERASAVRDNIMALYVDCPRVSVVVWSGLTATLAEQCGARFLLRGVRSVADMEYERNMADINRRIAGLETVILFALPEHGAISSSTVRELQAFGCDVNGFLPKPPTE